MPIDTVIYFIIPGDRPIAMYYKGRTSEGDVSAVVYENGIDGPIEEYSKDYFYRPDDFSGYIKIRWWSVK